MKEWKRERCSGQWQDFFDANNDPHASSTNGPQIQESIVNHFVLSRQFDTDEQRQLRLGTLNIHYN
jgi:hypothetical protein